MFSSEMKNNERKFFTPCFGELKEFIEESTICKRCQHQRQCKRVIMKKLRKPLKKSKNVKSRLIKKLDEEYPEYEDFKYGVDY